MSESAAQFVSVDQPVRVRELYQPTLIMVKTWPRRWAFACAGCDRDVHAFGWFGYVRCPFCRQQHAPKWEFPGSGY